MNEDESKSHALKSNMKLAREWCWKFNIWGALYYVLTILSVVSSAIAALRPNNGDFIFPSTSIVWNLLAGTGAVCAALIGALHPKEAGRRFNAAWIVLHMALTGPKRCDLEFVSKAREKGERLINPDLFSMIDNDPDKPIR